MRRTETEDFDEGALTLSDTDVRYRAPCCEADGDYQIFTNEFALGKIVFFYFYSSSRV